MKEKEAYGPFLVSKEKLYIKRFLDLCAQNIKLDPNPTCRKTGSGFKLFQIPGTDFTRGSGRIQIL